MPFTDYSANKIVEHSTGKNAWTMPTDIYVGLFKNNPGPDISGDELSGDGYARLKVTFDNATGNVIENDTQEDFPVASADWDEATHFALFDASTSGNAIWYGELGTPQTVVNGQQFRIRVGDIVLTVATTDPS